MKNFTQADYDPAKHPNTIDYSERVTEPGLVLSMREIYQRYAAAGVDVFHPQFEPDNLDEQEIAKEPVIEEKTDLAYEVIVNRSRGLERQKQIRQAAQEKRVRDRNQRGRKAAQPSGDTPVSPTSAAGAPAPASGSDQPSPGTK